MRIEPFYTTKHLAERGHEISLLAFQEDDRDTTPIRQWCDLRVFPFQRRNSCLRMVQGLLQRVPVNYMKYRHRPLLDCAMTMLRAGNYDVAVVDYSALGWFALELKKHLRIPVVTRWHNVDTLIWERWVGGQPNPLKRALGHGQLALVRRFERELASTSDVCLTVGARDTELLRHLCPEAEVEFLPPGIDVAHYAPTDQGQEPASILYMASGYQWHPNWDAVKWLYDKIMPRVWSRVPEAKLYITGKNARPEMDQWAATGRVVLTGFVPDERSVLTKATVMAVPMRLGGGIKLKMLTAFASGRAVVSTSAGAEGLPDVKDGNHLLVRDDPERFADAVIEVLQNQPLRQRLEANGRALVCERYDWQVLAQRWEQVLGSIIAQTRVLSAPQSRRPQPVADDCHQATRW